jgi:hypothetical protein
MRHAITVPELVPVLSAGRHRNPRKGACFMEMASFLAGERWSDHPTCTHPLLASLARLVNDSLPDEERSRIVTLIPDVVGLAGDDLGIDLAIATQAAAAALPVAPSIRQNVLAVGLLTAQRMAETLRVPGRESEVDALTARCRAALVTAPDAHEWAQRYARNARVSERTYRRQTAPHTVAYAVDGIVVACVADVPDRLVALLTETVHDLSSRFARPAEGAAQRRVVRVAHG